MRSKKLVDDLMDQIVKDIQERKNEKETKVTCTIPGHVHTYEKDEHGNFISECYSCKIYPLKTPLE